MPVNRVGKRGFEKAARTTVILEKEQLEELRQSAIQMSVQAGRLITPSEAIRIAVDKCYPVPGKQNDSQEQWTLCKVGELLPQKSSQISNNSFKIFHGLSDSSGWTQTPNEFFDEILPHIDSKAELKVILVVIRHTFGLQNSKVNQHKNKLSISDFERLTGMHRESVVNGLKLAMKRGLIKREEFQGTFRYWSIIKQKKEQFSFS